MEYEKSLFRVYERTISYLLADEPCCGGSKPTRVLGAVQRGCLYTAAVLIAGLVFFHVTFVGQPGCLGAVLRHANHMSANGTSLLGQYDFLAVSIENYRGGHPVNASAAQYEYSPSYLVAAMDEDFRSSHLIKSFNVSFPRKCFGEGLTLWAVENVVGYDTIMVNYFMHTMKTDGYLKSIDSGERWSWVAVQLAEFTTILDVFFNKVAVVLYSVFAFFIMSSVNAVVLHTLISSGVAMVYPIILFIQRLGRRTIPMAIVNSSYPWIGRPIERLQARNRAIRPLVEAHLTKVFVLYTMYEACQLAWDRWLYNKSYPLGLPLCLYSTMMLLEFYSMTYLRSKCSIRFFPRVAAMLFVVFHIYFYSCVYGFFYWAFCILVLLLLATVLHCLLQLETVAFRRSDVSLERPRACYTELGWPTWHGSMPPTYSLFYPVNAEVTRYQEERGVEDAVVEEEEEEDDDHAILAAGHVALPPAEGWA